jgi:dTDP-4-dehydrorhamnose reductase
VELGRFFMARGLRVVYLSSNAVFDGMLPALDERAATAPMTEYGRQKANCEVGLLSAAAELAGSCAVVRLTKVVDPTQPLYSGWMQNFKAQTPAKAAADMTMCPVTATYVACGLRRIGAGERGGVYHLSGERDMTYYELATAMATMVGGHASVEQDFLQQRLPAVLFPKYSAISMRQTTRTWELEPQSMAEVVKELTGRNV